MFIWLQKSFLGKFFFVTLALGIWLWGWLHAYVGPVDHTRLSYSTYLLDDQGDLLHVLLAKDERLRIKTTQADVDGHYLNLLLAYEDQRFWQHSGVDWLAMLRAMVQLAANGRVVSGASTLTMQAVRLMEPKPRTIFSKLDQMRKAIALEHQFSKTEILQKYLTLAPFGGNVEGVNAASLVWFNKWPQDLTPAQAALLVALPQSPESRRPDRFPNRAKQARTSVLNRVLEKGIINADYLDTANLSPIPTKQNKLAKLAPHLAWYSHNNSATTNQIGGKSNPNTSIDADLQIRLTNLATNQQLAVGLNMALLVVDNQTGAVKAYIGSQDYLDFNRHGAVNYIHAIRSPGSTLKPFVYGLAQAYGLVHFNTIIDDGETNIGGYRPKNLSKTFHGEITLAEALQRSLNVPAVKVMHRYGPDRFVGQLAAAGIPLQNAHGLPVALGGAGISLYELVQLYTALGNQGLVQTITPHKPTNTASIRLLPATTVAQLNWILGNNKGAAGRLHGRHGQQAIAYKTGTGPGGSDALALGTNGRYTFGVWVGTPDGSHVAGNTGLSAAVPIMNQVIDQLPQGNLITQPISTAPLALTSFEKRHNDLNVRYPVTGSIVHLKRNGLRMPLDIENADYPIWVSLNGQSMQQITTPNTSLTLTEKGGYKLTIVDNKYQSAVISFYVE